MGKVTEIKKANGEVMKIIDGEYVIGANSGCFANPSPCRKIIKGEYLVEGECERGNWGECPYKSKLAQYIKFIDDLPQGLNKFSYPENVTSCIGDWGIDENGNVVGMNYAEPLPIKLLKYNCFTGRNTGCGTPIISDRCLELTYCFSSNYCEDFFYRKVNGDIFDVYYDDDYFYLEAGIITLYCSRKGTCIKFFKNIAKIKRL